MKKRIPFKRYSNCRFTRSLLAACLLTGSAIATTARAQVAILATGQSGAGNIIVDGSRVYWINTNNAVVSSVDKLNGGVVRIHNPAGTNSGPGNYDLVQDNVNLYFASAQTPPHSPGANFNLYSVPKTSSSVTQLTNDPCNTCAGCTNSWGNTLAISNGWLYYTGGQQEIGNSCTNYTTTIEKISTQGGTPQQVIPIAANWPTNFGYGGRYYSVDNVYVHWSDDLQNAILRVPLAGAPAATPDVSSAAAQALITPITGPAGGYIFWVETSGNSSLLKGQNPGGVPVTLLQGVFDSGLRCFVQVGSLVYCTRASDGTIVSVPIGGGATPTVVVGTVAAYGPRGLTSDGTYLYWTALADGSIRRFTIPIGTPTPTPTPAVTTNPATNVASSSATLNGSLDPHGLTTTVSFQYGTTTSYGSTTSMQTQTGNTFRPISASISGLSASTIYHFRIVAHNNGGTSFGSDRTFTTLNPTGPPVVTTNPVSLIASFSATLNGSLDPHGLTTSVHFQYGTTTSYGLTTSPQNQSGNTYRNVSANISSLSANTIYHYRVVASNSAGTSVGGDRTFTTLIATGPPVVTTNPAANVTSSSATLNGSLDPHGLTTTVSFQYGTTTSYGHTTGMQSQTGNTYRGISANISSLTAHTTYHFRIVTTNSGGTRYGADRTFTSL